MTTITLTLPDDVAKQAEEKGLLSQESLELYVRDRLQAAEVDTRKADEGGETSQMSDKLVFDPCLAGLVNPAIYRKGKITGDIIGPFFDVWGEQE